MKKFHLLVVFISLISSSFLSCKTASKAYDKGNYTDAVELSVKKLQKDPHDVTAKAIIKDAYANAISDHENQIRMLSGSNSDTRWERIYNEYRVMQRLYEMVRPFTAVARAVNAVDYTDYLNTYRNKAADVYLEKGMALMNNNNKEAYREAYNEFGKALRYRPEDSEIKRQRKLAYENAVVHVLIVSQDNYGGYMFSNSYQVRNFQNDLMRSLSYQSQNDFVRFYSEWDARGRDVKPDEIIEMRLGRFEIGRPYDEQSTRDVSKEVVEKEIVYKADSVVKQYRTVHARITTTRRTMISDGELYINIRDANGRFLWSDNFRGEHRWQTEFATYTGDQRALSNSDKELLNKRSNNAVPRQEEVMEEVLRRIENETVSRLRNYYNRYL